MLVVATGVEGRSEADPRVVAALRCQKAVVAAADRFAGGRDRDAGKCVASLVRCLMGRPEDTGCAFRASGACAQSYQKQATLLAGLRASIRKRCDAASLLATAGIGFDGIAGRCTVPPNGAVDAVDHAIACLADAHVCAGARTIGVSVPRTAALVTMRNSPT